MTQTVTRAPIGATDRCDRCGAQAHVRVRLDGGSQLMFCGHHFRQHEVRLRSIAVEVQDQTADIR
jgi:ribosomal protein S14